jgi:thioredoxin reductase (NADPH)
MLDCIIVGGGPSGLTAGLYLGRFNRKVILVDGGAPRAAWIPESHNIPFFAEGISGARILSLCQASADRHGVRRYEGHVAELKRVPGEFSAQIELSSGEVLRQRAKHVLLATGAVDVEPDLPDLPNAVQRGLVRFCPICDGREVTGRRIAVFGHGDHALAEAVFIARTYSSDVTILTAGHPMVLGPDGERRAAEHRIRILRDPVARLTVTEGRISALWIGDGGELQFDALYSALGLQVRSELARLLGARMDDDRALIVDAHNRTSVPGLYAAGDVVQGLSQIVVGMSHAAIAATDIHNRCELPTEEEAAE